MFVYIAQGFGCVVRVWAFVIEVLLGDTENHGISVE